MALFTVAAWQRGSVAAWQCDGVTVWHAKPGLGTSAASRCTNSSGDMTRCVVPSRQAVLSLSTTCLAALALGL